MNTKARARTLRHEEAISDTRQSTDTPASCDVKQGGEEKAPQPQRDTQEQVSQKTKT